MYSKKTVMAKSYLKGEKREKFKPALMLLLFASVLFGACSSSRSTTQVPPSDPEITSEMVDQSSEDYRIQPGDNVEISVWGYEEFDTNKNVTTLGIITVPLIGEMQAEGLTKDEFKDKLESELTEYIKGDINLSVNINSPQRNIVSVFGFVGEPDNYPVVSNTSLFEIISRAGGTTENADLRRIKLFKGGEDSKPIDIDLTHYLEEGNTRELAVVDPGDIVYVPEDENAVRELTEFIRDVVLLFSLFRLFN